MPKKRKRSSELSLQPAPITPKGWAKMIWKVYEADPFACPR